MRSALNHGIAELRVEEISDDPEKALEELFGQMVRVPGVLSPPG